MPRVTQQRIALDAAGAITIGRDEPQNDTCFTLSSAASADPRVVTVVDVDAAVELVRQRVSAAPLAARVAVEVLAEAPRRDGIVVESLAYSTLQSGPEFARWLSSRTRTPSRPEADPLRLRRDGDTLRITLDRPSKRNALDARMRDAWLEALWLVELDPELRVVIDGSGPSFCSGGDLDEFGTFTSPAEAHELRVRLSIGARIAAIAERVSFEVHGTCAGSGIEIPAFASHVAAHPDSRFLLPELDLGLIPGAGGTLSIPRRIGRWRTAWMVLSGLPIDAQTALSWGLVDELHD